MSDNSTLPGLKEDEVGYFPCMANERLSKLQKWTLETCLEKRVINSADLRAFYGKEYPSRYKDKDLSWRYSEKEAAHFEERQEERRKRFYLIGKEDPVYIYKYKAIKDEFISTKAEDVAIFRSLKNLCKKGLLESIGRSRMVLTERGFLIANNFPAVETNDNNSGLNVRSTGYKDYRDEIDKEIEERRRAYEKMTKRLRLRFKGPTDEERKVMEGYQAKFKEYQSKFNTETIANLCCEQCLQRVRELEKESGVDELNVLAKQVQEITEC